MTSPQTAAMRVRWALYLDALNKTRDHARALEQTQIKATTVRQWRFQYQEFQLLEDLANSGRLAEGIASSAGPGFPKDDFLEYRRMVCAYQIPGGPISLSIEAFIASGIVVRALVMPHPVMGGPHPALAITFHLPNGTVSEDVVLVVEPSELEALKVVFADAVDAAIRAAA